MSSYSDSDDSENERMPDDKDRIDFVRFFSVADVLNAIMEWLAPVDVVNFIQAVRGTGISLSKQYMDQNANLLRCIIPNRRWLNTRIKEGYTFTVIGRNLSELTSPSTSQIVTHQRRDGNYADPDRFKVYLIITKDGRFVKCTEDFAATALFQQRPRHECIWTDTCLPLTDCVPQIRTIRVCNFGYRLTIMCPLIDDSTAKPQSIISKKLGGPVTDPFALFGWSPFDGPVSYSHAALDKTEVAQYLKRRRPSSDIPASTLFWLMFGTSDSNGKVTIDHAMRVPPISDTSNGEPNSISSDLILGKRGSDTR